MTPSINVLVITLLPWNSYYRKI